MIRKAIIPAAGKGTRMLEITKGISKEMLEFQTQPLIKHAIQEAQQIGCTDIAVITNKTKKDLNKYLEAQIKRGLPIKIIFRDPKGLLDVIKATTTYVQEENFIMILPDLIVPNGARKLLEHFTIWKKPALCVTKTQDHFQRVWYPKVKEDKGKLLIKSFVKEKGPYSGCGPYIFPGYIFSKLKNMSQEDSEKPILDMIISSDELHAVLVEQALDFGNQRSYARAKRLT